MHSKTKSMKLLIIFSIVLLGYSVSAQSWETIYSSSTQVWTYHTARTKVDDDGYLTAWVKISPIGTKLPTIRAALAKGNPKKAVQYKQYAYSIHKYTVDCEGYRTMVHSIVDYTAPGTVIYSFDIEEYLKEWKDTTPDTVMEKAFKNLCKLFE